MKVLTRSVVGALALGVPALAALADVVDIGNEEFRQLMRGGAAVVDLRTPGEWRQTGVVKGSQLVMLFDEQGKADVAAWARHIDKIAAPDQPLVLICRTGNRSGKAAQMLEKAGRKGTVYNVKAGIVGWAKDNQPVVSVEENLKQAGITCTPTC